MNRREILIKCRALLSYSREIIADGWVGFATIYSCYSLGNLIGDKYYHGAQLPGLIGIWVATFICCITPSFTKMAKAAKNKPIA
ncbi:hypothetical protein F3J34_08545 [Klebsiella sp. Ap-873]|nr:hypothetical protein [Klebsiella sp. Ap-873]